MNNDLCTYIADSAVRRMMAERFWLSERDSQPLVVPLGSSGRIKVSYATHLVVVT